MPETGQDSRFPAPGEPGYALASETRGVAAAEIIAVAVSLIWLALAGGFYLLAAPGDAAGGTLPAMMLLVSVFMPLALIWLAAVTARHARAMRAESRRLQSTLDALRQAYLAQAQSGPSRPSTVERRLDEIAAVQRQTETTIASFASRREGAGNPPADHRAPKRAASPPPPLAEEQPGLALGTPADALSAPVSIPDFIKALNFPDTAEDRDGFRALRVALDDRALAKLVRASQDVLTLLSQDGIYMDDLRPDRARPEVWRRFGAGERGRAIAALGGVRDRSSLALSAGRMRHDAIFRDAAHHFLRQFDKSFAEFEKDASDQEVAEFAETRTARAFMLLGRVTGIFD